MPVLAWRSDTDGFAFVNSWSFDATERSTLSSLAAPMVPVAVGAVAAIFPDPIFLAVATGAAFGYVAMPVLPPVYGLCGGLAYASADHWRAKVPLPRGAHEGDQPARTVAAQATLRTYVWNRLITSLTIGGAMQRTIEWSLLLNQVPTLFGGGAPGLRNRTLPEMDRLIATIDGGQPCPIAVIETGVSIWDQHQVLVYGYEHLGPGRTRLFITDNNFTHQYGNTSHRTWDVDLSGPTLVATAPGGDAANMLVGFFCTNYIPAPPPADIAPRFGEFQMWTGDAHIWQVIDGARMPVANVTELGRLGGSTADVRVPLVPFDPGAFSRPRDGALLRELDAAPVFVYQGGSPFWVPDPTVLQSFGGWDAVRVVPNGTLAAFVGAPDDGTLLKELSDPKVYRIEGGTRRWVKSPVELDKWGGWASVRPVPDGALADLPEGPTLPPPPPPNPNECAQLTVRVSQLNARIAQLDVAVDNADGVRLNLLRIQLTAARSQLAAAQARRVELNCPA